MKIQPVAELGTRRRMGMLSARRPTSALAVVDTFPPRSEWSVF